MVASGGIAFKINEATGFQIVLLFYSISRINEAYLFPISFT